MLEFQFVVEQITEGEMLVFLRDVAPVLCLFGDVRQRQLASRRSSSVLGTKCFRENLLNATNYLQF